MLSVVHSVYRHIKVVSTSVSRSMSQNVGKNNNRVYRLVLTGGPCGGKTTSQARLSNFFENLGWKVYRVPEVNTVLQGCGVKWTDLSEEQANRFQENLLRTMLQVEDTFNDLASQSKQNNLLIFDRGTMDATAYMSAEAWEKMRLDNHWNEVELRDNRYNQVIHMVSAAEGAEQFYTTEEHVIRYETVEQAQVLDAKVKQAWVGHPYFDVIDNSTDFETKVMRMIASVCSRLGIDAGDRLQKGSKKRKFLVSHIPEGMMDFLTGDGSTSDVPGEGSTYDFPQFQDFVVVHEYLSTPSRDYQARIRKRGQNVIWDPKKQCWDLSTGDWSYIHTIRKPDVNKQKIELKMSIAKREYVLLLAQKARDHMTIYKRRRCFLWNNQYFHLDIYQEPCHPRCKGLIFLETYTTSNDAKLSLPTFLNIKEEVTENPAYSMYNLSLRAEWSDDLKKMCSNFVPKQPIICNGSTESNTNAGVKQS